MKTFTCKVTLSTRGKMNRLLMNNATFLSLRTHFGCELSYTLNTVILNPPIKNKYKIRHNL